MTILRIVHSHFLDYHSEIFVNGGSSNLLRAGDPIDDTVQNGAGSVMEEALAKWKRENGELGPSDTIFLPYVGDEGNEQGVLKNIAGIIHCAVPDMRSSKGSKQPKKDHYCHLLRNYIKSIQKANSNQTRHIVFPLLGAGFYGYPYELSFLTGVQSFLAFVELLSKSTVEDDETELSIQECTFVIKDEEQFLKCKQRLNGQTEFEFNDPSPLRHYIMSANWKQGVDFPHETQMYENSVFLVPFFGKIRPPIYTRPFCPEDLQVRNNKKKTRSLLERFTTFIGLGNSQFSSLAPSEIVANSANIDNQVSEFQPLTENNILEETPTKSEERDDCDRSPSISMASSQISPRIRVSLRNMTSEEKREHKNQQQRERRLLKSAGKRLQAERNLEETPTKREKQQDGSPISISSSATMSETQDVQSTLSPADAKRLKDAERQRDWRARKSAEKAQALLAMSQAPSNSQLSRLEENRRLNTQRQKECRARKSAQKEQGIVLEKKKPMTPDDVRLRNNESHRVRRDAPVGRNLTFTISTPVRALNLPKPHYLGPMNVVCRFCDALHFKGKHGVCCSNGKVWTDQFLKELPKPILRLLEDANRHFIQNIVSYNSLLAMASNVYTKEPVGRFGVQAEKVMGPLDHWVSALAHNPGSKPAFGNFYSFNAEEATEARMNSDVVKTWAAGIDKEILLSLTKCLEQNHPLAQSYRMMHEVLKREEEQGREAGQMCMRIVDRYEAEEKGFDLKQHPGTYSVPVGKEYVCVFFTCRTDQKVLPRGLNVYQKLGRHKPVQIKNYLKVVDPLCYPLMFPYGEGVWEANRYPYETERREFVVKMAEYNEKLEEANNDQYRSVVTQSRDQSRPQMNGEVDEDDYMMDQLNDEEITDMMNSDNTRSVRRSRISRVERNGEFYDVRDGEEEVPFVDGYTSEDSEANVPEEGEDVDEEMDSEVVREENGNQMNDEETDFQNNLYDMLDQQDRMREAFLNRRDSMHVDDDMIDNDEYIAPAEDIMEDDETEETVMEVQEQRQLPQNNGEIEETEAGFVVREESTSDNEEERRTRTSRTHASMRENTVFLNRYPKGKNNRVAQFRKLGQLHIIDMDTRIIHQKMEHIQKHFTQTLQTTKKKLIECLQNDIDRNDYKIRVGSVTTVPSHVPGSPRYMRQKFENAVALANAYGHPDVFITFTGSAEWREIKENIPKGDSWADHPMIVAKVFREKLDDFLETVLGKKDTNSNSTRRPGTFGEVAWFVYSVEFQQRGMPHVHLILSLKDHIKDTAQIDKYVWARIPELPEVNDPNYKDMKILQDLVFKYMVHRPCKDDPTAYCQDGKKSHWKQCTKRFPKPFTTETHFGDQAYPDYYRPEDGIFCMKKMSNGLLAKCDNSYVVPYNPILLAKYGSHINVEIISSIRVVKYLFKYIFKGFDRTIVEAFERFGRNKYGSKGAQGEMTPTGHILHPARLNAHQIAKPIGERTSKEQGIPEIDPEFQTPTLVYDETAFIEDMRAITACEAAWDISAYERCVTSHSVVTLYVHAPDEEPVKFIPGEEEQVLDNIDMNGIMSRMKAWFKLNQNLDAPGEKARTLTFDQLPSYFTYNKNKWTMRKNNWSNTVMGRVKSVQPRYMEQYAIRLLSMHQKGPRSFEELRTVNGQEYDSFVGAAKVLRLMNDEMEWDMCLTEAATFNVPVSIRRLFISILVFCAPANPLELWEKHKEDMFANTTWSEEKKTAHALSHIRSGLQAHGMELSSFNLPDVIGDDLPSDRDYHNDSEQLHDDNSGYTVDVNQHAQEAERYFETLNEEQLAAVKTIIEASAPNYNGNRLFFIEGAGGTGKTYVYKCLYHTLIARGLKVLCVAHTGIAANLLMNGSTVHRAFGIPITMDDNLTSQMDVNSYTGHFLRSVDVIIWDEASMSDRRIYEAVDNFLRLLTGKNAFMGGLLSIFGGDWRQTLPIVEDIPEAGIVNYTLQNTDMWRAMTKLKLTKNQRALNDPDFCKFLLTVGDGAVYEDKKKMLVRLPQEIIMSTEQQVIEWLYGGKQVDRYGEMAKKALLTVDNRTALELNEKILKRMTGETKTYMATDETDTSKGFTAMDPELYKSMTPSGMPPHQLNLKKNCQVILLRNQNVKLGLCNGTRMRVVELNEDSITCEPIRRGPYTPQQVILHRMNMTPARAPSKECAFVRHQFPIRLAFAMTINKSQGQTLDKVGVILRTPCFAHGQLYVALSRVREKDHIRVYSSGNPESRGLIKNKVNNHVFNK